MKIVNNEKPVETTDVGGLEYGTPFLWSDILYIKVGDAGKFLNRRDGFCPAVNLENGYICLFKTSEMITEADASVHIDGVTG